MNSLADLQRDFLASVRHAAPQRGLPWLAPDRRVPPELGLGIYINAYRARLHEALETDHAILGRYLGDEPWARLCDGYITAHPSRYRSLRQFGDPLPDFLRRTEPFSAHPQIAELAAFERRLLDAFDAADAERVDWQALQAMPAAAWPGLRLRFHPSLQPYRSCCNSVEIWQALKQDQPPPDAIVSGPLRTWAIWRNRERITQFRSLEAHESESLAHLLGGGDFAGLCERMLQWFDADSVPAQALGLLQRWVEAGWVAQFAGVGVGKPTPTCAPRGS